MEELESQQITPKNNSSILIGGIIVATVLIGGYLMMSNNRQETPDAAEVAEIEAPVGSNTPTSVNTINVTMRGDNFKFSQSEIRAKKGDTVKVTLTSDDMPHDFVIDELNVKSELAQKDETVTVEFVASEPGTYEYYCSFGSHRKMGMIGTLIVE